MELWGIQIPEEKINMDLEAFANAILRQCSGDQAVEFVEMWARTAMSMSYGLQVLPNWIRQESMYTARRHVRVDNEGVVHLPQTPPTLTISDDIDTGPSSQLGGLDRAVRELELRAAMSPQQERNYRALGYGYTRNQKVEPLTPPKFSFNSIASRTVSELTGQAFDNTNSLSTTVNLGVPGKSVSVLVQVNPKGQMLIMNEVKLTTEKFGVTTDPGHVYFHLRRLFQVAMKSKFGNSEFNLLDSRPTMRIDVHREPYVSHDLVYAHIFIDRNQVIAIGQEDLYSKIATDLELTKEKRKVNFGFTLGRLGR